MWLGVGVFATVYSTVPSLSPVHRQVPKLGRPDGAPSDKRVRHSAAQNKEQPHALVRLHEAVSARSLTVLRSGPLGGSFSLVK